MNRFCRNSCFWNTFKSFKRSKLSLTSYNYRSFASKSSKNDFQFTWKSFGVIAFGCSAAAAYYQIQKDEKEREALAKVVSVGKPDLGGPYVMYDQDGNPVTDATFRGQYVLLYFGFTHCPDICPSELLKVAKIQQELAKKKAPFQVKPVFISVDPARDTIAQLKYYSQDFHPSFSFLTGTKQQIDQAARAYRVYFSKVDKDEELEEEYLVDHSIVLYLIDPNGEFLDFYTQGMTVKDITEKILKEMKSESSAVSGK